MDTLITPHEIQAELVRLIGLLDQLTSSLADASQGYAQAALHYAQDVEQTTARHQELNATKLDRIVASETAVAKAKRQIADNARGDALTHVVNARLQITAWQTMARLVLGEVEMSGKAGI